HAEGRGHGRRADPRLEVTWFRTARDDENEDPRQSPSERVGYGHLEDRRPEDRADHVRGPRDREEEQRPPEVLPDEAEGGDRTSPADQRPQDPLALVADARHAPGRQRL